MASLKEDDSGKKVLKLQRRLQQMGFSPGDLDGEFGPSTRAAVLAYQRSEGLLVDGVAGPRTRAALGLAEDDTLTSVIPQVTVTVVSRMFPLTPTGNIKQHLQEVLAALEEKELGDKPMVLMALATIRAETEGFVPVGEGISKYNTSPNGHPFDLYDNRRDLGNNGPGDGERFKGRGFIQLTGRDNYRTHGVAIGLGEQLLETPALANDAVIAAKLLASFLADRERAIKQALVDGDLAQARKLVNGGAHGLDRFTEAYRIGNALIA